MASNKKRMNGVYYTTSNPFKNNAFNEWAQLANLPSETVLEPFAGNNSLINHLINIGMCEKWSSFDLDPKLDGIEKRDSLLNFPKDFSVCITNPPWLAKNSASRRRLPFPSTNYDDIYKLALEKCLWNCKWVGAVIPESFIRSNLFQNRLSHFVSLTGKIFDDTESPVGLALFQPDKTNDVEIWRNNEKIGLLSELEQKRPPKPYNHVQVQFNASDGNVGLIAIDNNHAPSIRFCDPDELKEYNVRPSCRSITKLMVWGNVRIDEWNTWLASFREATHDVLLTSFKGMRKDGMYRRRMDWELARGIINHIQ